MWVGSLADMTGNMAGWLKHTLNVMLELSNLRCRHRVLTALEYKACLCLCLCCCSKTQTHVNNDHSDTHNTRGDLSTGEGSSLAVLGHGCMGERRSGAGQRTAEVDMWAAVVVVGGRMVVQCIVVGAAGRLAACIVVVVPVGIAVGTVVVPVRIALVAVAHRQQSGLTR